MSAVVDPAGGRDPSAVTLAALGVTITVDPAEASLDPGRFRRLWSRALTAPSDGSARVALHPGSSMESATQEITRAFIEQRQGQLLMFHAGAVADPTTGRSLVYVAPGGTGKSTLTTKLGREFGYLTDETVGIDPATRRIHPYPKPVTWASVRGERKIEHSPDELGMAESPPAPHVGALMLLRRAEGREASFRRLGLIEAVRLLVPETSSLSALPGSLSVLADLVDDVGCTLVEYGEADDILEWCRAALTGPPVGPRAGRTAGGERRVSGQDAATGRGLISLAGDVEVVVVGDEGLALAGSRLLSLGPVSTAIVGMLATPQPLGPVLEHLESRFGAPEGAPLEDAVESQLAELRAQGVVAT